MYLFQGRVELHPRRFEFIQSLLSVGALDVHTMLQNDDHASHFFSAQSPKEVALDSAIFRSPTSSCTQRVELARNETIIQFVYRKRSRIRPSTAGNGFLILDSERRLMV